MRRTAPLFRPDAGWLFVTAGLAVCAAGVILPAQGDLKTLQQQLDTLRTEEARAYARLKAYNDFVDELDEENPALVRRLAASQLNIVPATDRPVLLSTAQIVPVTNWIEATVSYQPPEQRPIPDSTLSKLANGPMRLWLFAGGIMCVFVGLLMGGSATMRLSRREMSGTADESRLDLAESTAEVALVADSTSDAATVNEDATTELAQTTAAIDELARAIAGEVEGKRVETAEAESAVEVMDDDVETEDEIGEADDNDDDDDDESTDESDDEYVMEHAGSDEEPEEDDGDETDDDADAEHRSR